MAKRKSKKRKKVAAPVIKKYPIDPDNLEIYEPTADEFAILEPGSGGKPQAWKAPSQFDYDQLRKKLIACGCDENTLVNYTITDAVRVLKNELMKLVEHDHVGGAKLRVIWRERYWSVVNEPERLRYWQQKEKDILNRMVTVNNEQLAKNNNPSIEEARRWLSEIWPFGEHCERLYKLPNDLNAIYLAVGLQLDRLFRAINLVTEQMVQVIIGEWQLTVQRIISDHDVFLQFGPCFNGEFMAYATLEIFWGYIEADLENKGLFSESTKPAAGSGDISNTHSEDFRSVTWDDRTYTFNKNQAIAVKLLWNAMERDEGGIHQNTIAASLETVSKTYHLLDTFRQHKKKHPAWSGMIHHLGNGVYILKKPKKPR